jgi:REP element-mobilizing transposase RayT
MPNHFHLILVIQKHDGPYIGNRFQKSLAGSVSTMINAAKGATTKWCNNNNFYFDWQDKFHDHAIRNEEEYWAIKNYIFNNPRNWKDDCFYM